jgi:hypothetical protein
MLAAILPTRFRWSAAELFFGPGFRLEFPLDLGPQRVDQLALVIAETGTHPDDSQMAFERFFHQCAINLTPLIASV